MPVNVYSEIEEKLAWPTLCRNEATGEIENAGCAQIGQAHVVCLFHSSATGPKLFFFRPERSAS